MKPTRPETGYGYIEADLSVPSTANKEVFRVYSLKRNPIWKQPGAIFKKIISSGMPVFLCGM